MSEGELRSFANRSGAFFLILFILLASNSSGASKWNFKGPFGTTVRTFTFDPRDDRVIYAANFNGGLFRSKNAGNTWERMDIADGVYSIRIHEKNPEVVIAAGSLGVFQSTNLGKTWQQISQLPFERLSDLEFDPVENKTLYAMSETEGVFKSTDRGRTWRSKNNGLKFKEIIPFKFDLLEVDPKNRKLLYAFSDGILFRSTNAGNSWQISNQGFESEPCCINFMEIDPNNPEILYLGGRGVFKSTDRGANWFTLNSEGGFGFSIDPKNSQVLYTPVEKSTDGGASWRRLDVATEVRACGVGVHPTQDLVLIGGFGFPILRSNDGGDDFKIVSRTLDAVRIQKVISRRPDEIFAVSIGDTHLLESRNAGKTWDVSSLISELRLNNVFDFDVSSSNPDLIVTTIGWDGTNGFAVSFDAGRMWTQKPIPGAPNASSTLVALDSDSTTVYLNLHDEVEPFGPAVGLAKSTDLGDTWKVINSGLRDRDVTAIKINPHNRNQIFAGTSSGKVFISNNGGQNWRNSSRGLTGGRVTSFLFDAQNQKIVYVSADSIFKSIDGGKRWTRKMNGFDGAANFIAEAGKNSRKLFAGTFGGLFVSGNGAESWNAFASKGLGPFQVYHLLDDTSGTNALLASTERGIFSYSLGVKPEDPVIEEVASSPATPGETVVISGANFGPAQGRNKVLFSGINAGNAESWSDNRISIKVPNKSGSGTLVVIVGNRKAEFDLKVVPSSETIQPSSGPVGTLVTMIGPDGLAGTQFNVMFGGVVASEVSFTPPNIITCKAPPGSGVVQVSVANNRAEVLIGDFTYR